MKILNYLLLLSMSMLFTSCDTDTPWDYPHLLDPKDFVRYYGDFELLKKDLELKGYTHEPYGKFHGSHEIWEQWFKDLRYEIRVMIHYNSLEDKLDSRNPIGFEVWVTTNEIEQESDRFKRFIEEYTGRIKSAFPKTISQNYDDDENELILSSKAGYEITINDFLKFNQFIVIMGDK